MADREDTVYVLDDAVVIGLRLRAAHGEGLAREYLATLPDADAALLWKCLRRLGWWFPDDQRSNQERLVWWLFRDDVTRLDFSDGTERQRPETPEERLTEAGNGVESLWRAAAIQCGSCLSVAYFVRLSLFEMGRNNNPPLYGRCRRCGWPDESGPEGSEQFDVYCDFCIRFDGECLDAALSAAASRLGFPSGRLNLRDATGRPWDSEQHARQDMVRWLEGWRDVLMRAIFEREELPSGWGATDTTWPTSPIKTVEHLREWLSSWLRGIHQARSLSSSWSKPESYLDDVQRELWNARLAMREWKQPLPKDFNAKPTNIRDAEEQLILLVDGLAPLGGDASTPTVAPTELDFPLEWAFQYGSILTPLEGTFETTANGLRLREDKVTPPHPVRNLVELLRHVQGWASIFRTTRRELELAKEVKTDAQTIAEWTARLLDETRRELRNARLVVDDWIDDPAKRPTFSDRPTDIHDAKRELTRLIDGLAALLLTLPSSQTEPTATTAETESARLAGAFISAANLNGSRVELVASPVIDGKSNWNPRSPTGPREPFGLFGTCGEFVRESTTFVVWVQAKTSEALDEFERLADSAGGWLARFGSMSAGPWMASASPSSDWVGWLFLSLWDSRYVAPRVDGTFRVSSPFTASTYLLRLAGAPKQVTEANDRPPKPVERQVETLAGSDDVGGGRGEAAGNQSKGRQLKTNGITSETSDVNNSTGQADSSLSTVESAIAQLNHSEKAIVLVLGRNGITTDAKKLAGERIAQMPRSGLKFKTPMKTALAALQRLPYQFLACPGRGYYLTERGTAAYTLLTKPNGRKQKSGQSHDLQ